ncbi:MAG TPA: threonyl-tRNA synthetase editing domain-containing protein [Geobacterales bacterium]|nr:threonyl-tRNA synthetase editing domain-containing protein [Geobacterales bacterium]
MKILALHCDYVRYEPIEKEIKYAEDTEKKKYEIKEVLLLLTAIEVNDNEETIQKCLEEIKRISKEIAARRILIYPFAHLSKELKRPSEAIKILAKLREEASKIIETHSAPFGWNKSLELKIKGHPLAERLLTI